MWFFKLAYIHWNWNVSIVLHSLCLWQITRPMLAERASMFSTLIIFLLSPSFCIGYNSGPQPFWHQGPVWRKTIFPWAGWGMVSGWFKYLHLSYTLLCTRASLVAQMVKNLPAVWEIWVQSLGWEDPLEKQTATHSSILAWRIGVAKSQTWLSDFHSSLVMSDNLIQLINSPSTCYVPGTLAYLA